ATAALADLLKEFVAADAVAGLFKGRQNVGGFGRCRVRRRIKKFGGTFAGSKESFDTAAQSGITPTRLVKISRPLLGRQFHRRVKDRGFAKMRLAHGSTVLV